MTYLTSEAGLKVHKGIQYDRAIEYFRGVQFHVITLQNEAEVLKRIPSFVEDKLLTELKTVEDSTKLG